MASCLGIYVNKNIIKYAKVTKDREKIKVETFGIKIYSNLKEAIKQIISETFSFKIPVSINIEEETYSYFYMSNLLSKNDLKKAVATEFESLCYEKEYNPNALESRYVLVNDVNEKDKVKVIHASINKIKINNILQNFEEKNVSNISPISFCIANIAPLSKKENSLIVNIEDKTTITTITGEKIYDVQVIDNGAEDILEAISLKENSYLKAYEMCKNTTIYTMGGKELEEKENEYLENIIPTLYTIANRVKEIVNTSLFKINKIYITGTMAAVNNIDLYFGEIIPEAKCEILKPFFVEENLKVNMKDYIEVNSAIALALQGLDYGLRDINFNKKSFIEQLPELLNKDIKVGEKKTPKNEVSFNINTAKIKSWIIRDLAAVIIFIIGYVGIETYIKIETEKKEKEIATVAEDINAQMKLIDADKQKVDSKTSDYDMLVKNLQNASDEISTKNSYKNVIPTLLSEIMNTIPKGVQLTSIENTTDKKIIINAQSEKYEQLAIFKTALKSEGILKPTSVVSSEAVKEGDLVKIVIEGELP